MLGVGIQGGSGQNQLPNSFCVLGLHSQPRFRQTLALSTPAPPAPATHSQS